MCCELSHSALILLLPLSAAPSLATVRLATLPPLPASRHPFVVISACLCRRTMARIGFSWPWGLLAQLLQKFCCKIRLQLVVSCHYIPIKLQGIGSLQVPQQSSTIKAIKFPLKKKRSKRRVTRCILLASISNSLCGRLQTEVLKKTKFLAVKPMGRLCAGCLCCMFVSTSLNIKWEK